MDDFGDKPYGLSDVKITDITGDTQVDLPTAQVLTFKERTETAELPGDDKIASVITIGTGVEWSLGEGGISLEAYALMTGRTLNEAGTTPNQTRTLTGDTPRNFPYFRIYGKSVGENDDDIHCKIFKAKLTSALEGSFENGKFFVTKCSGIGVPNSDGDSFEFVQNETAADLPAAESVPALILATNPLAYWPLNETSGVVARNLAAGRSGINIVKMPGFEVSPWDKWTAFADDGTVFIGLSAPERVSGSNGLGLISGGTGKDTRVLQILKVTPGINYTVKIWTMGDGVHSLVVRISKGDWSEFLVNASTGKAGAWSEYTVTFDNPAGNATVNLELAVPGVEGAFCYVDDVQIYSNTPDATVFDGIYYGSPTLAQPGLHGNSVLFDGSQCVNLDLPAFDFIFPALIAGGTFLAFAKTTVAALTDDLSRWIFKLKTATSPFQFLDCFESSLNNALGFQYSDAGNQGLYKSYPWTTEEWFSIGATWSDANGFKLYIKGIQRDTTGLASGVWNDLFDYVSMAIGAGAVDAAAGGWIGNIQHVVLWDTEFTAEQMLQLGGLGL